MDCISKKSIVEEKNVKDIPGIFEAAIDFVKKPDSKCSFYYRGETENRPDNQAFIPGIYRIKDNKGSNLHQEHIFYNEAKRYCLPETTLGVSTFKHLSVMQHFNVPTRLIDISEDIFIGLYFALRKKENGSASPSPTLYILAIEQDSIEYCESDTVALLAIISKLPFESKYPLSKENLYKEAKKALKFANRKKRIKKFKKGDAAKLLYREISSEQNTPLVEIDPKDLFRIVCVRPSLDTDRIRIQKGAFILFGLNYKDVNTPYELLSDSYPPSCLKRLGERNPIQKILKINIKPIEENLIEKKLIEEKLKDFRTFLGCFGVKKPYIYPDMENVAKDLLET